MADTNIDILKQQQAITNNYIHIIKLNGYKTIHQINIINATKTNQDDHVIASLSNSKTDVKFKIEAVPYSDHKAIRM